MALYPKFPFGPSAAGAASVRALESVGGAWQRKNGPGYSSRIMGDFSRVTTGGFEYVTQGRTKAASPAFVTYASIRYQITFIPGFAQTASEYLGQASYFQYAGNSLPTGGGSFTYPVTGAPLRSVVYQNSARSSLVQGEFLTFFGSKAARGTVTLTYHEQFATSGYLPVILRAPNAAYLGAVTTPENDQIVISPALVGGGARVDAGGRTIPDLAILVWAKRAATRGLVLTFGRPDIEFLPFMPVIATRNHGMFMVMERLFVNEVYGSAASYRPRLRLFRVFGKDVDSVNFYDVTTQLNADGYTPAAQPGNPLVPGLEADFISVGSPLLRFLNSMNSDMMSLMTLCALNGDKVLVAYTALVNDPAWISDGLTTYDYRFRYRVARIDLQALTAVLPVNEALGGIPGTASEDRKHIDNMLHLGNDVVLAKQVGGWKGIDHPVKFMVTVDAGDTWSEVAPSGLEAPLLNQYFGRFTLHRAAGASTPATVLMPAWSTTALAYFVFESTDNGATWSRRGRIAKPDAFYRVDSMISGDGGGNFERLHPGSDLLRPADLASPDRFNP